MERIAAVSLRAHAASQVAVASAKLGDGSGCRAALARADKAIVSAGPATQESSAAYWVGNDYVARERAKALRPR